MKKVNFILRNNELTIFGWPIGFGNPIEGEALEALKLAIEKSSKKFTNLKNRY